jgi:hypothetical protein|tara:strand:+ start:891 stop:1328 length:438 start_codon:yes stop_codon:yes gene_type:complete
MSRETARADLVSSIAQLTSKKNWLKGVSQEYQVINQPNGTDHTARGSKSAWTGAGLVGWLTEWKTANSSITATADWNPADFDGSNWTHDDWQQFYFQEHAKGMSNKTDSDKAITDIDAELTAYQSDMDDIDAGIAAGDVDQVDPS